MKDKKLDKKLLQKFRAGKCSAEELRKVLLWYQSEEAETAFSLELENYWTEGNDHVFLDKDKVFREVKRKIESSGASKTHNGNLSSQPFSKKKAGFIYQT